MLQLSSNLTHTVGRGTTDPLHKEKSEPDPTRFDPTQSWMHPIHVQLLPGWPLWLCAIGTRAPYTPIRGGSTGGQRGSGPPMKNVPPVAPRFGPASLDIHLNRPVIFLIQLQNTPVSP